LLVLLYLLVHSIFLYTDQAFTYLYTLSLHDALPIYFKIKKVKLRGIESNGMICSLQELSVDDKFIPSEFAEGIIVLPEETEIGSSVEEILNLDDIVLDIDLTPNRADALSMLG